MNEHTRSFCVQPSPQEGLIYSEYSQLMTYILHILKPSTLSNKGIQKKTKEKKERKRSTEQRASERARERERVQGVGERTRAREGGGGGRGTEREGRRETVRQRERERVQGVGERTRAREGGRGRQGHRERREETDRQAERERESYDSYFCALLSFKLWYSLDYSVRNTRKNGLLRGEGGGGGEG